MPDGSITIEEAAAALASLPKGKAPGSDGLPYEFYQTFWPELGEPMVAAFNYALQQQQQQEGQQQQQAGLGGQQQQQQQQQPVLSARQRLGLITLIYKGGGKPREQPNSYRPLTLLNADVKILAKVLARRIGPVLGSVVDSTQTAFVPGRDIADNVLLHLEEIDYLQEVQQPGCILFLDFSQAYDRLDRGWLWCCMQEMQFPATTISWVRLLLAGTQARITFNGGSVTRLFDIPSGCAQGSPLSPLLYVIAAQPLAARCRQLQAAGQVDSISMPDGTPAPCCHQHADDTSLHAASRQGTQVLLEQAVQPFCQASGALLNKSKCQGLTVGSHPPFVGRDAATGVPFPNAAEQPIKHLGVLLSAGGAMPHAQQLYTRKLQSLTWRVRRWSRQRLTLLGKCEVARQSLAPCFTYHAQFVPVPPALLDSLHRRITAFVLGKPCLPQQQLQQLRCSPPAAVRALPSSMGGVRQVDVRAHTTAMLAKVAAAALHPRRAPWKQFFAANLQRAMPGLGIAAVVQQSAVPVSTALAQGHLKARHAAYVQALQHVGVQRHVPHAAMSAEQVRLELLVGNHSVGDATTGSMLRAAGQVPHALGLQGQQAAGARLGDVRQRLSLQPGADPIVLPPEWRDALQQHGMQPAPAPAWRTDQQQRWAVHSTAAGQQQVYQVRADGSLTPASAPTPPITGEWQACCVVDTAAVLHPVARAKAAQQAAQTQLYQQRVAQGVRQPQQAQQPRQREPALFLVGPWHRVMVDPSVWGCGWGMGLLQFSVAQATSRLLQAQCSKGKGWVPGVGQCPRIWRRDDGSEAVQGGLRELELGQKRRFAEMLAGSSSAAAARRDRFSTAAQLEAYHAAWMDVSPPRLLPRQRAANRAAVITAAREQQESQQQRVTEPVVDDLADPLTGQVGVVHTAGHAWLKAYARVHDRQLPRQLRVFGWQLLHAAVPVGALRMHGAHGGALMACACQQQPCQEPEPLLATLSHVFVQCPVAEAAWQWVADTWQRVQPGPPVPVSDVRVILLDDSRVWAPARGREGLWTLMRLLMLESLYVTTAGQQQQQQQQEQPISVSAAAAAAIYRCRTALQRLMQVDWLRVGHDLREDAGVPLSWLRGPAPMMSSRAFQQRWQGMVSHASDPPTIVTAAVQV